MQAPEQVASEVAVSAHASDLRVGLMRVDAQLSEVDSQRLECVWHVLHIVPADPSEEGCGVGSVIEPMLLLPAHEAWSPMGDFFDYT